jgi:hypothetical protein
LQTYYGDNDGILPLSYQSIGDYGTPLVRVREDHFVPVQSNRDLPEEKAKRRGITSAIFMATALDR